MEELLNKLIKRGWKPFGMGKKRKVFARGDKTVSFSYQDDEGIEFYTYLIRDVVSKESGLWKFVCLNRLWKDIDEEKYWHKKTPKMSELRSYDYHFEEFRLIESSLKEESELEDFLLDNIKL